MLADKADQLFYWVCFDSVTVLKKGFRERFLNFAHVFEQHITIDEQTTRVFLRDNSFRQEVLQNLLCLATAAELAHSRKRNESF